MAFENENDSFSLNTLKICNKDTHITLEGILKITKDKKGLALARQLKRVIDASIEVLKQSDIPDALEDVSDATCDN